MPITELNVTCKNGFVGDKEKMGIACSRALQAWETGQVQKMSEVDTPLHVNRPSVPATLLGVSTCLTPTFNPSWAHKPRVKKSPINTAACGVPGRQ